MGEESREKYVVWGGPLSGDGEVLLTQREVEDAIALGYHRYVDENGVTRDDVLSWPELQLLESFHVRTDGTCAPTSA